MQLLVLGLCDIEECGNKKMEPHNQQFTISDISYTDGILLLG
jgi:hypothetical protein